MMLLPFCKHIALFLGTERLALIFFVLKTNIALSRTSTRFNPKQKHLLSQCFSFHFITSPCLLLSISSSLHSAAFYLRFSNTEHNFISRRLSWGLVSRRRLNNWRYFLCFLSLFQRLPSLVQKMSHNKLIWAKHFGPVGGILIELRM